MEHFPQVAMIIFSIMFGFALNFLKDIAKDLNEIKKSLAIAVTKIDDHEKRITKLEKIRVEHV